jgi:hypothetical protein
MPLIEGDELKRRAREGAARAINVSLEDLLAQAVEEAPVDTGALRASGHVNRRATPRDLDGLIAFPKPYAAAQHEGEATYPVRGKVVFRNHPKGGKKKYVEDPLKANAQRYEDVIAASVKREIERGD